jgi:hypothetical protein
MLGARRNDFMGLCIERRLCLAAQVRVATALALALCMCGAVAAQDKAAAPQAGVQPAKGKAEPAKSAGAPATPPAPKLGLSINDPRAYQGYTLFTPMMPMSSTKTYLIDLQGKVVRTWESDCSVSLCAYHT